MTETIYIFFKQALKSNTFDDKAGFYLSPKLFAFGLADILDFDNLDQKG